ncbi:GPP34 family phosphoprotein [Haloechinothrix sp. YIM 98757]|uniref:GPP34 family phosphoprotein n=1 Tax=Haloechinothrix aidingensis TaxID=2752311 RepID=A0A838AAT6_9PSEU|nr:GPP34 family phosphoprotein [Haloechinothrix aidingensis]MBA0126360.1 GPP34 family phosphoprotein [Haloechinothrix aidingensis]
MMLAEDLLLLASDDDTGRRIGMNNLEYALAGALLIELVGLERVDVADDEDAAVRLTVRDGAPPGEDFLAGILDTVAELDGRKPKDVILGLSGVLATRLLDGLAERGVARADGDAPPAILPVSRWPSEESSHEYDVRARLRRALLEDEEPDERTAALISLLAAIDAVPRVAEGVDRAAMRKRAKSIAEGQWATGRNARAIEEITAMVMVAALAPTMITESE